MKLSTAVRKGSKGRVQGKFYYEHQGKFCVLGAAKAAANAHKNSNAPDIFPQLRDEVETEGGVDESIWLCVTYQNDYLGWSFDEIADWLEYYGY